MALPLEQLESLMNCPVCSKKYRGLQMQPVAEEDRRTTLHFTCEHCGGKSLVSVSMTPFGVISFGILTDLERAEAERYLGAEPVSVDQVLAAHHFFKEYRGGVETVIGEGK